MVLAAIVAIGGLALTGYAHDLSRASLHAYGMEVQTIIGAPVVWIALHIPQLQWAAMAMPILLFIAWRMRRIRQMTYLLYMVSVAYVVITWTITVAYFSLQPAILG
ncbi:MAG TPA: hypothetical protein VE974_08370 [Thermoanaerobaculia bacterium]|nr:hypothetical protein [Thermoanaerobaculia bacterium]